MPHHTKPEALDHRTFGEGALTRYRAAYPGARRYWAVYDSAGALVCVCLYKKGAEEVVRRLTVQTRGQQ